MYKYNIQKLIESNVTHVITLYQSSRAKMNYFCENGIFFISFLLRFLSIYDKLELFKMHFERINYSS